MPRVLAFRHAAGEDVGNIRPALESRGVVVDCVDLYAGASIPAAASVDGLIFMGGAMCANDDLPFLRQELDLIRDAIVRQLPIFGVCLGAQLIAKALGGRVYPSAVSEIGWHQIEIDRAASEDPVFSALPPVDTVFQLHYDTFDLPPGAVRLASSAAVPNQAFRLGASVYGVQFHPEMTPAMIEDWRDTLGLPLTAPPNECARLAGACGALFTRWSELL